MISQSITLNGHGIESGDRFISGINYDELRNRFIEWFGANVSKENLKKCVSYLDKYLRGKTISNPREIFDIIKNATNKRNLCVTIRNLLNYLEAFDLMREEDLARYRKIVKIPRTNPDSYIPDDKTVINAFSKFEDNRYKIVFKLLLYSGLRIREALELLKDFDKYCEVSTEHG